MWVMLRDVCILSYRSYLRMVSVIKEQKLWFNHNFFTHRNHQYLYVDDLIFSFICIICDWHHLVNSEAGCTQLNLKHIVDGM